MRELLKNEAVVQIWSQDNPSGDQMRQLAHAVAEKIKASGCLGTVSEIEGPTAHIPDYFSDLYGTDFGWLIYISETDPIALKRFVMELEMDGNERITDIDVFVDYFTSISRTDLGFQKAINK